ncbi:hypothetical protein THAOC_26263, partial [Thalassiosira oceanica]
DDQTPDKYDPGQQDRIPQIVKPPQYVTHSTTTDRYWNHGQDYGPGEEEGLPERVLQGSDGQDVPDPGRGQRLLSAEDQRGEDRKIHRRGPPGRGQPSAQISGDPRERLSIEQGRESRGETPSFPGDLRRGVVLLDCERGGVKPGCPVALSPVPAGRSGRSPRRHCVRLADCTVGLSNLSLPLLSSDYFCRAKAERCMQ